MEVGGCEVGGHVAKKLLLSKRVTGKLELRTEV